MNGLYYEPFPFSAVQVVVSMSEIELTGTVSLVSFRPGPAGMSTADIGDGIAVNVDFAEPGRLCNLDLPLDGLSVDGGPLDALIGPEGRRSIRDVIADPTGPDLRKASLGSDRRRSPSMDLFDERAAAAGRILTAIDVGDDFDEHPLVRAIARFEVFQAVRTNGRLVSADRLNSSIGYAVAAIENDLQGERILTRLSPDQYQQLVDIVRGEVQAHPRYGARISKHIVGLLGDHFVHNGRGIFQQPLETRPPDPSSIDALTNRPDVSPSPGSIQPSQVASQIEDGSPVGEASSPGLTQSASSWTASLSSPGRLEVSFTEKPNGGWIKVFDPNLSLIAAAPIINSGARFGGWNAQAVIPEELSADGINIEVTSDPGTRTDNQFERIMDAVDAGQRATQLHTFGQAADAAAEWKVCAGLWKDLGDATRSNMAMAYSRGNRQVTQLAQLHDAVRALT